MTFQIKDLPTNQEGSIFHGDYTVFWYLQLYAAAVCLFASLY